MTLPNPPSFILPLALSAMIAVGTLHAERRPVPVEREAAIGEDIALFIPQGYKPQRAPSLAFAAPPVERGPVPAGWKLRPDFFLNDGGKAGASVAVPAGSSLYGGGEVTGPLLRNGKNRQALEQRQFQLRPKTSGSALPVPSVGDGRAPRRHGVRRALRYVLEGACKPPPTASR